MGLPRTWQTRSEPRTSHQASVRVFGMDSAGRPVNQTVSTVDISRHGARLEGLPCWSGPGEIIGVRCGVEKARYKVVWTGQHGTPQEGHVGLLCVEAGKFIWGSAAPASEPRLMTVAAPSHATQVTAHTPPIGISPVFGAHHNRRREARYRTSGGAKVQECGAPAGQWAMLHDISIGGCYVETSTPLNPGTRVDITAHVGEAQITAKGEVTVAHRLVGMGVKFTDLTLSNRQRLESVLQELARSGAAET